MKILMYLFLSLTVAAIVAVVSLQAPTEWSQGEVVRTPEARFADLPDYPFEPNYLNTLGYRLHYLDEGPRDAPPILLLHGQPSWSYLYRHMIPPLVEAGHRVLVPDLVGFGKSDKPVERSDYSYQMHVDVMTEFARTLDLRDVTFFGQDWGGLIGLRVVAEEPDRFARIMISNTGLPAAGGLNGWLGYPLFRLAIWREGTVEDLDSMEEFNFARWVAFCNTSKAFDVTGVFQGGTARELSEAELRAYAAPFPDERHKAGARVFPSLVPSQLRENEVVMRTVYDRWEKPFLTAFGDSDPVTAGLEQTWIDHVPGASGQPHAQVEDAHHFIQEDQPAELVARMLAFIASE